MSDPFILDWYEEEKRMLLSDDPTVSKEAANRLLDKAKEGDHEAQAIVGENYYYGTGFTQDYEQAFYWCRKACITGNENSLIILGHMYEFGHGVERDLKEAIRWYQKEVANGYTYAAPEYIQRCMEKLKAESEFSGENIDGLPKVYLEAYEEWFAEENQKKTISKTPQKAGDYFYMGQYFMGTDQSKAPILWRVIGEEEDRLLVVSEYCLHWIPYSTFAYQWSGSKLQVFMEDLYESAFTEEEKAEILSAEDTGDSEDVLFALSVKEANQYFKNHEDRLATATPYAITRGAYLVADRTFWDLRDFDFPLDHAVCWWLRDKGFTSRYAADVLPDGWVCDSGDDMEEAGGVRPAMWIKKETRL